MEGLSNIPLEISSTKKTPDELLGELFENQRHIKALIYSRGIQQDVEDITQEVLIKASNAIKDGGFTEKEAKLKTWLYKIVTNCINDYFRKKSRRPIIVEPDSDSNITANINNATDPKLNQVEQLLETEKSEKLYKALEELTPNQREVLKLRLEGKKVEEIANILGTSLSATKLRLKRAIDATRSVIKN